MTPLEAPPSTVIWPPVLKVWLGLGFSVIELFDALYDVENFVIGWRTRFVTFLTRFVVTVST